MPYIYVKDFATGLDSRRMGVNTPGGALLELTDAHINRGGEVEARKAFPAAYALPAGTIGLAASPLSLYVFGSGTQPAGVPAGVLYQRLQHADGVTALVRVLSTALFAGKLYVVGLFADASIQHFYDGVRVANWFDGRAKASFAITGGTAGTPAVGSFKVTGGTVGVGNQLTDLTVDGVSILGAPVPFVTDIPTTAQAIVDAINLATVDFVATRNVDIVVITSAMPGTGPNGDVVLPTPGGTVTVSTIVNMAGGTAPGIVTSITVDAVAITGAPVPWALTDEDTAADVAAEINTTVSSPEYGAVAVGNTVIITAAVDGTVANGKVVVVTKTGTITVTPPAGIVMAGGADPASGSAAQAAKATFRVTAGSPAVEATGRFSVDSGGSDETLTTLTVNAVPITSGPLNFPGSMPSDDIAMAIAADITAFVSTPNYTATTTGNDVLISAVGAGASGNGAIAWTGTLPIIDVANLAGGNDGGRLLGLAVNGVATIGALIEWAGAPDTMAAAIAAAVNAFVSVPEYTAGAVGDTVTIAASTLGAAQNGFAVGFTKGPSLGLDPVVGLVLSGGADDVPGTFQPGAYVRTIKNKMYSTSGPNLHFSGVDAPTEWETDTVGAGFINMAKQASGSEDLSAIVTYRANAAIFAKRTIQVWFLDIDPAQSQQVQVLENTGTSAPLSVVTFGDQDVFYLDDRGVRSLQARNTTNAAFASDIGNAVDTLVQAARKALPGSWKDSAIGLIEPEDGRFWLIMKRMIFVFTNFTNSKISAWSTYMTDFDMEYATVFGQRVFARSGDSIHVYGGLDGEDYAGVSPVVGLPFLDAAKPGNPKKLIGFDCSCEGVWDVYCGTDPNLTNPGYFDHLATVSATTFALPNLAAVGESTHFALRFVGRPQATKARLGSVLIHYLDEGSEAYS